MKNIKIVLFTLLASVFFTTASFALSNKVMPNPETLLRAEISALIGQPDSWVIGNNSSIETTLTLMVNANDEIVLIDSGTKNPRFDKYVTKKLSNKKIKTENIPANQFYYIKIEFRK